MPRLSCPTTARGRTTREPSRRRRAVALPLALLLAAGALGSCSVVSDAAQTAACAAVTPVAQSVGDRLDELLADIAVDPQGAVTGLTQLRDNTATAVSGVDGRLGDAGASLVSALDGLVALAQQAADGATVTPGETADLRAQTEAALTSLVGECPDA
ncbi:hypothetical protein FH969_09000 [Miniimonas arenae]|uniref:Uncharacterized protein n=1 Tax=Miniimonas arenae TaxID=676201 RepID=A0A5C5BAQ6_9MICO|nr:hypothetical protein [Miniimonas arenae]TNU73902.1 hypothetical protein FH969_09000 [Miniimonas arenae]